MSDPSLSLMFSCWPAMAGVSVGWWLLHAVRRWIEDQYTLDGSESLLIASRVAAVVRARQQGGEELTDSRP
jgi:hypothetical protein